MDTPSDIDTTGLFEARYTAFLETIVHLRPRLHRYCARMTGSVLDGEDVMQEAVFEAYRKLDTLMTTGRSTRGCSGSFPIAASTSFAAAKFARRPKLPLLAPKRFCRSKLQ